MTSAPKQPEDRPRVDDTDGSDVESATPREPPVSKEYEPKYPKGLALGLIMGAVWLSLFLVALVSTLRSKPVKVLDEMLTITTGSNNLSNCRTQNHRSIPLTERRWMVWQFVYACQLLNAVGVWTNL
jgi:hypothetical protein